LQTQAEKNDPGTLQEAFLMPDFAFLDSVYSQEIQHGPVFLADLHRGQEEQGRRD